MISNNLPWVFLTFMHNPSIICANIYIYIRIGERYTFHFQFAGQDK